MCPFNPSPRKGPLFQQIVQTRRTNFASYRVRALSPVDEANSAHMLVHSPLHFCTHSVVRLAAGSLVETLESSLSLPSLLEFNL